MNPDGNVHPVIYVRIRQRRNIATVLRGQTWFWETILGNNTRGARSRGFHTNRDDCEASARLHFSFGTTVFLQQDEQGDVNLRWGQSATVPDPNVTKVGNVQVFGPTDDDHEEGSGD